MIDCINIIEKENIFYNEPLSKHSTIGIGGIAKVFALPTNFYDLLNVVKFANESGQKYKIIGAGSNILFDDKGYDGIIISTKNMIAFTELENDRVLVSSGYMAGKLIEKLKELNLSGFEWAIGIPATIGGMVVQNAGAHGSTMRDIVSCVTFFENGKMMTLSGEELNFSYRDSYFKHHDSIIMSVELKLKRARKVEIEKNIKMFLEKRLNSQPQGRSLGSVFKNSIVPAGKLIEDAKLKGTKIGGIVVSDKHANFFINEDNGTAKDFFSLMCEVKLIVSNKFGIMLDEEIEYLKD